MTSREPRVGDKVIYDGKVVYVVYVSPDGYGVDLEDECGRDVASYVPDEYDQIVYADSPVTDSAATGIADNVQHPAHYAHPSGVEVIEITKYESFLRGNILKYVLRAPYKGNELEDMQKAAQYLQWEIERLQETASK